MNQKLQQLLDSIQQSAHLSDDEKNTLSKTVEDVDKEMEITSFKLDRTEKVKRTTSILLEETIEELEQKRKAVEAQNRELEIESSLERVRTVALSMNRPDDMLHVCRVISEQLQHLNVQEIRNVQTAIFYKDKGTYMNYEYYSKHNKTVITETSYTNNEMHKAFATQMMKGAGEFFSTHINGDKVKDWIAYQKTTNVFIDDYLYTAASLNYYWYSLGPVALGISTYEPLREEDANLFRRFVKVFELAYRRYLDIEKAQTQAKEVQIELALERVRARTMAMQKSDELAETSLVLFQQFKDLGETSEQISIGIFKEDENIMELYSTLYGSQWKEAVKVDLDEPMVMKKIHKASKEQKKSLVIDLSGKHLREYNAYRKKLSNLEYREDRWVIHIAFFSKGVLTFSTTDPHPHETIQLLERFAGVFDGTYTRFLDLQKAEAQAKESQIQLALERVRARTMAMQKSEELPEAANLLFQQLQALGMPAWSAGYCIWDENKQGITLWMSSEGVMQPSFHMPLTVDPSLIHMKEAYERKELFHVEAVGGDELVSHYNYMRTLPGIGEILDSIINAGHPLPTFQIFHCAYFSQGFLLFITYELVPEAHDIFKRFAKIFEQTYTRFLDLQKAEAQARESQIQLAMERVRARTMAMQRSGELSETASEMFKQIQTFGMYPWACGFNIFDKDEKAVTQWMSIADGGISPPFRTPLTEDPTFISIYEARQKRQDLLVKESSGKELEETYRYIFSLPDSGKIFGDIEKSGFEMPKFQIMHCAYFSQGYLVFITYEQVSESWDIFKRFAKVFEQTYTRFLDLQKSEAQARESQIQLALERVRARTMAMQHSNELPDAALLLSTQVKELGVQLWSTSFQPWDNDRKAVTAWTALKDIMLEPFKIPATEDSLMINISDAAKKGKLLYVEEMGGKVLENHLKYMNSLLGVKEEFGKVVDAGFSFPTFNIFHAAYFSTGFILFITEKPYPEAHDIFKRFAKVFEQTYTRFLDLQKAEAQARESQIELGLERVRARAMAMQKSDELSELVDTVFKELTKLDFALTWCIINIIDESSMSNTVWAANPDINKPPESYHMLFEDYPFHHAMMKGWKERKIKDVYILEGQEKKIYDEYLFNETEFRRVPATAQAASRAMEKYVVTFSFSNFGGLQTVGDAPLSDANLDILSRFGKVFDLTYTRFNDLKQAEAQARESQIQLALERVRARTMAMQKSDELKYAATLLFQQVKALGVPAYSCGYNIWEKGGKEFTSWMSTQDGSDINGVPNIPLTEDANFIRYVESKQNGEPFFGLELRGERMQEHYEYLKTIPAFKVYFDYAVSVGFDLPQTQIHYIANFSQGNLLFITLEPCPEFHDVFKRFAVVFEQTYTRFLDLQKAEAQAREAKIEVALERARTQSMIMQHSKELDDTLRVFHEQVLLLGIHSAFSFLWLPDENKDRHIFWAAWAENNSTVFKSKAIDYPLDRNEPATAQCLIDWKSNEPVVSYHVPPASVKEYFAAWSELIAGVEELKPESFSSGLYYVEAFMKYGCFGVIVKNALPEDEKKILGRFAIEFERTYTRFLDLQKAEAQAKESQIEAALERVRSRSMGMQKSEELKEVIQVVYDQFIHLNIKVEHTGFVIDYKAREDYNIWIADPLGVPSQVTVPYFDSVYYNRFNEAKKNEEDFFATNLSFEEKNKFYQKLFEYVPGLPEEAKEFYFSCPGLAASTVLLDNVCLYIENFSGTPYTDEENNTLMRFGKVFQQTYTRFLDLQKAEAQAREAKIEAALERVRSRTMGMQHSNELQETALLLLQQVLALGVSQLGCGFNIWEDDRTAFTSWMGGGLGENTVLPTFKVPTSEDIFLHIREAAESGELLFVREQSGEELKEHYRYMFSLPLWKDIMKGWTPPTYQVVHCAFFAQGFLMFVSTEPVPQAHDIFKRLAKAFEQTYTRFLDLQKAEAQAREAQIEAALERVRSRGMAMYQSTEMNDVAIVLFEQLRQLGGNLLTCGIVLCEENSTVDNLRMAVVGGGIAPTVYIPNNEEPVHKNMYEGWKTGKDLYTEARGGEELKAHYDYMMTVPSMRPVLENLIASGFPLPTWQKWHAAYFSYGYLLIITLEPYVEEQTLKRFAKVFEQTYTRFLDLQKAEAQAREAQIEASLERVRSRTMAMQHSSELADAAMLLFRQMRPLDIPAWSTGYCTWEDNKQAANFWMSSEGLLPSPFKIPLTEEPVFIRYREAYLQGEAFYAAEYSGEKLASMYAYMMEFPAVRNMWNRFSDEGTAPIFPTFQINHVVYFAQGFLLFVTHQHVPEAHDIFIRFGKVFEQTYTRFLDLQKAEAQAREAIKQTSLDRVRGQIASMRSTEDLQRITPLIWHELTSLGVPFIRCGVLIIDEAKAEAHIYLSSPDGHSLAAMNLPLQSNTLTANSVAYWRKGLVYTEHWDKEDFIHWMQSMIEQGQVQNPETYQGAAKPPESLHLHFVPFTQGMLYVGNTALLTDDEIDLVKSLAEAFSIAYARYEDFTKLEKAKQSIEVTLTELKATQTQLIQSEKMASLGELTAGIAHEIQNPLNFVNNFSEVNQELLAEMTEEIDKGNYEEAKLLAKDVTDNEEKINHHGKRADAIVKGMLQHSRSNTGVKEPTDINALADEYLRLAYHGLRAKDKSFNATMKTDYDETLEKVNVIPQDIGRVILNLITNAFYAMHEKANASTGSAGRTNGYEPTISVSTKKSGDTVFISVKDNGGGIPQKVVDKIFQPFFTTKPTGQGTGLGLSLSYDIMKAHGGEIKVETKEGEGSEFIIQLPSI